MTPYATLGGMFLLLVVGGLGFPVPEDVTLLGSGILVRGGSISLWQAIAVGIAGVCLSDWIVYLTGRRYGPTVVRHPLVARVLRSEHVDAVDAAVRRHGAWAVFVARFVFGARIATFLSAGTFGVSASRFAMADSAGGVLFVSAMVTLGFVFAHEAQRVAAEVGRAEHWILLGGLLALGLGIVLRALAARWFSEPPSP
jgi:membrane protein DedA with SNARE-associated domain